MLSPTALPLTECGPRRDSRAVATALGVLGYPGFAYLKKTRHQPENPASVLFHALSREPLEPRVAAALPWLMVAYPDLDWFWLVDQAKRHNLQNRLGFLVALARRVAELKGNSAAAGSLSRWLDVLDDARLLKEDTLGRRLTDAEKRYLRQGRPDDARHWNVLTNLQPEHVQHVG